MNDKYLQELEEKIKAKLIGRKIVNVSYMTRDEAKSIGISRRPIIIELDDKNLFFPIMDDEGNDGGSLNTSYEDFPIIGTI